MALAVQVLSSALPTRQQTFLGHLWKCVYVMHQGTACFEASPRVSA